MHESLLNLTTGLEINPPAGMYRISETNEVELMRFSVAHIDQSVVDAITSGRITSSTVNIDAAGHYFDSRDRFIAGVNELIRQEEVEEYADASIPRRSCRRG